MPCLARAAVLALGLAACAVGGPMRSSGDGSVRDGGPGTLDAGLDGGPGVLDAGLDAGPGALDAGAPPADAFVPPVDGGPSAGRGAYLDRCTTDTDCATGTCADDVGPTRFCTLPCTSEGACASEHTCAGGRCVPEDTGAPCSTAAPDRCAAGLCLGSAAGGRCTRFCDTSVVCPAGYACTVAGGSTRPVCVDIERPCAAAADCGTGLCIPTRGCTASCRTAADCPARLGGLPPYACAVALGSTTPICVPPDDIAGDDPIGAACVVGGDGLVQCRSGGCDDSAPLGPMCTQACNEQGGCAPGLGCFPLASGGEVILVCERAGAADLGQPCGAGRDCHSGLCDASGYCTRLCGDGLCPTGWSCLPVAGTGVALCRR
jgi:hypothetical protein